MENTTRTLYATGIVVLRHDQPGTYLGGQGAGFITLPNLSREQGIKGLCSENKSRKEDNVFQSKAHAYRWSLLALLLGREPYTSEANLGLHVPLQVPHGPDVYPQDCIGLSDSKL